MKRYVVHGVLQVGVFTVVEAASKGAAKRVALERGVASLTTECGRGSSTSDHEWRLSDGLNAEVDEECLEVVEES